MVSSILWWYEQNIITCLMVLCLTLCDPMDYTVHGILQAKILEWVTIPFSRGSSHPGIKPRWILYQLSCQGSPWEEGQLKEGSPRKEWCFLGFLVGEERVRRVACTCASTASQVSWPLYHQHEPQRGSEACVKVEGPLSCWARSGRI